MGETKPDCTLSDGTQVNIDLTKITIEEWRDIWSPYRSDNAGDTSIAKLTGMTDEQVKSLKLMDYKLITTTASRKFQQPLADPT